MPRFETLADLHREQCGLLIRCRSCDKHVGKSIHQLTNTPWQPGAQLPDLEAITIASVTERMK